MSVENKLYKWVLKTYRNTHPLSIFKVILQFFFYCTAPTQQNTAKADVGASESSRDIAGSYNYCFAEIYSVLYIFE